MIAVPIGPRIQRFATAAAPDLPSIAAADPEHPRDLLGHACVRGRSPVGRSRRGSSNATARWCESIRRGRCSWPSAAAPTSRSTPRSPAPASSPSSRPGCARISIAALSNPCWNPGGRASQGRSCTILDGASCPRRCGHSSTSSRHRPTRSGRRGCLDRSRGLHLHSRVIEAGAFGEIGFLIGRYERADRLCRLLVASHAPFSDETTPGRIASVTCSGRITAPRSFQTSHPCRAAKAPRLCIVRMHQQGEALAGAPPGPSRVDEMRSSEAGEISDSGNSAARVSKGRQPSRCAPLRASDIRGQLDLARRCRRHDVVEQRHRRPSAAAMRSAFVGRIRWAGPHAVADRARSTRVIHQLAIASP